MGLIASRFGFSKGRVKVRFHASEGLAKALLDSLKVEMKSLRKVAMGEIWASQRTLGFYIESKSLSTLRASVNSILRMVSTAEKSLRVALEEERRRGGV